MDNMAAEKYIGENHPEALESYQKLTVGAAKADLWRLIAIYKYGGIYWLPCDKTREIPQK
ncbi:MAG: glycosyltransferase [Francisella endosymbiont of Hyalomma scupense]